MDTADRLGERAWDEFYTQKLRLYGDAGGRGQSYFTSDVNRHHRFYKAFRAIAEMCIKRGVDVTDYIITCFSLMTKNHRYITPRDFANPDILTAYLKHKQEYGDDARQSWASQSMELRDIVGRLVPDVYADTQAVLVAVGLPFTAWFRVFVTKTFNPVVAELYGAEAWHDLQVDKRLRTFLRPNRPETMEALERQHGYFGDIQAGVPHE